MGDVDAVSFPQWNQRNEKHLEIRSVNHNNCIHLKTVSVNFAVFFADGFSVDAEDKKHRKSEIQSTKYGMRN